MACSQLQGRQFYCREWAFHKLAQCLETRADAKTCGVLVSGGQGCGKTAFCAELVWPTVTLGKQVLLSKRVLSSYFCESHDVETLSLTNFILTLVDQLQRSTLIGGYSELLHSDDVACLLHPQACESEPDVTFNACVIQPLLHIAPPAQCVILMVDGVDESLTISSQNGVDGDVTKESRSQSIAQLLARHHQNLPKWLLLLCCARKQNKQISRMFSGFRKIALDDLRKGHVIRDVQQYILCRLDNEPQLCRHLSKDTAEMLNQLHIKSNGCFLYLEKVLDGVSQQWILLREIREIPGTLNGLYLWLCQRVFKRDTFEQVRPILNVILAARRPLTDVELFSCNFTRNPDLTFAEFQASLDLLSRVLADGKDGAKIVFHQSFAEWLLDVKHCTQKYLCDAAEGHAMIALSFAMHSPSLSPPEIQDYTLHLVRARSLLPSDPHLLPLWLLQSGANVLESLSGGLPKDEKVLEVLKEAGAQMEQVASPAVIRCVNNIKYEGTREPEVRSSQSKVEDAPAHRVSQQEVVENLLRSRTDVNALDSSGRTLLHDAALTGNTSAMQLLLSRGAHVQTTDRSGQTALNMAARNGHTEAVAMLLQVTPLFSNHLRFPVGYFISCLLADIV